LFRWLLLDEGDIEENLKKDPEISEYYHVPDITALADKLRSCLQESDELPKDFTTLFNERLYKFDTDLIPEALQLYESLGVKHEPLTLIPPQFETPMPSL
jgi:intraflagellar transport protein 52